LDRRGIPYLSHSKVVCLERCPRCYYRQYILGEKEESTAMLLGTLFHVAAMAFYAPFDARARAKPTEFHRARKAINIAKSFGARALVKPAELLDRGTIRQLSKESRMRLLNALTLLRAHHWEDHEVLSLEEPFFMDLARGLPPIIGIPDLVLQRNGALILVDHKTSKSFNDLDPAQLILYAEHLRRHHHTQAIVGVFDEYRLVPDLSTIKKPAFRRTPVSVDRSFLPPLVQRYRSAWKQMLAIDRDGEPSQSFDCWVCSSRTPW
jgi:hypothetical protein